MLFFGIFMLNDGGIYGKDMSVNVLSFEAKASMRSVVCLFCLCCNAT